MKKEPLLELAKKVECTSSKLYCMKANEELEEAIKDTIKGYKETIFGSILPSVWRAWMNFESSRPLISMRIIKG